MWYLKSVLAAVPMYVGLVWGFASEAFKIGADMGREGLHNSLKELREVLDEPVTR